MAVKIRIMNYYMWKSSVGLEQVNAERKEHMLPVD
jgi:hypothetical protein